MLVYLSCLKTVQSGSFLKEKFYWHSLLIESFVIALLHVGAAKLGISAAGCTLVLEEDGTVIDDYDVLVDLPSKTLMLLQTNEHWMPATLQFTGDSMTATTAASSVLEEVRENVVPTNSSSVNQLSERSTIQTAPFAVGGPSVVSTARMVFVILVVQI